jgi:hypothetical protein
VVYFIVARPAIGPPSGTRGRGSRGEGAGRGQNASGVSDATAKLFGQHAGICGAGIGGQMSWDWPGRAMGYWSPPLLLSFGCGAGDPKYHAARGRRVGDRSRPGGRRKVLTVRVRARWCGRALLAVLAQTDLPATVAGQEAGSDRGGPRPRAGSRPQKSARRDLAAAEAERSGGASARAARRWFATMRSPAAVR